MTRIEIDLPDQPGQIYPEAVARRLFEDRRLQPDAPARLEGSSDWLALGDLLEGLANRRRSSVQHPPPVREERRGGPVRDQEAVIFAMKRYGHGQALVKGLNAQAVTIQILGVILGLLVAGGFWLGAGLMMLKQGPAWPAPFLAALFGLLVYGFFARWATFLRLQASLLAATIDTAVYTCPFLEDADRMALLRRDS